LFQKKQGLTGVSKILPPVIGMPPSAKAPEAAKENPQDVPENPEQDPTS
jgi:hypothetical protein